MRGRAGDMEKKTIVIYGCGDFGQQLYHQLEKWGIKAEYFCQTEKNTADRLFGLPVLSVEELLNGNRNYFVFIAICNHWASYKISVKLKVRLGMDSDVYIWNDFIETNLISGRKPDILNQEVKKYCVFCDSQVQGFLPWKTEAEVFHRHHVIGAGSRDFAVCPYCGGKDRERWLYYVLKHYTGIFHEKCRVLHFAPEKNITAEIMANSKCDCFSGDIVPGRAEHVIDVTDIPFKENCFDYIIINHVMNYIEDERQAFQELKRVLKADGRLLLSFPICMEMKTYEDNKLVTDKDRFHAYGDPAMVRIYGDDFKERIEQYGFHVETYSPKKELKTEEIEKNAYIPDDIMIVCSKTDID